MAVFVLRCHYWPRFRLANTVVCGGWGVSSSHDSLLLLPSSLWHTEDCLLEHKPGEEPYCMGVCENFSNTALSAENANSAPWASALQTRKDLQVSRWEHKQLAGWCWLDRKVDPSIWMIQISRDAGGATPSLKHRIDACQSDMSAGVAVTWGLFLCEGLFIYLSLKMWLQPKETGVLNYYLAVFYQLGWQELIGNVWNWWRHRYIRVIMRQYATMWCLVLVNNAALLTTR